MPIEPAMLKFLKESQQSKSLVYFGAAGVDASFQSRIVSADPARLAIVNTVPPELIHQVASAREFQIQVKMLRFRSPKIETDGVSIVFPLHLVEKLSETRAAERMPFEKHEKVVCQLLNPLDQQTWITKPVLDMSATGMSLQSSNFSKLFTPGRVFPQIRIMIDDQAYTKASARVVYKRKLIDIRGKLSEQVGFEFIPS
jgi:hypothetical protein